MCSVPSHRRLISRAQAWIWHWESYKSPPVFMSMAAFNGNSIKCLVSFVEWIDIARCYLSSNDLMTSQETKRQSIVMISFSFCEKFLNISVREQHTRARLQLRYASFAFNPLVPWFETNQERNIRTAHQKVFQMGSIHVIDHMPENSWVTIVKFSVSIESDEWIRQHFRDAQKSGHGEWIFKTVCNV